MRKYKLPLLLGLLLAGIITVWLLPSMLRLLPTRYAMRLPAPLQALALPADPTPILPTVAAPVAAADLLGNTSATVTPVSYTHLDVYKRQPFYVPPLPKPILGYRFSPVEVFTLVTAAAWACLLYTSRCV